MPPYLSFMALWLYGFAVSLNEVSGMGLSDGWLREEEIAMVVEKKLSWTKKGVFKGLKGGTERNCSELAIKAVEGADASIVVSMCAVGDAKISVTMNGEEVLAEVVLFSVEKDDMAESEVN